MPDLMTPHRNGAALTPPAAPAAPEGLSHQALEDLRHKLKAKALELASLLDGEPIGSPVTVGAARPGGGYLVTLTVTPLPNTACARRATECERDCAAAAGRAWTR